MGNSQATHAPFRARINGVRDIVADVSTQMRVLQRFALHSSKAERHERAAPRQLSELSKRLLIISHYSPPYRSAFGTQRLAKYIKYLDRWDWRITLVTTEPMSDSERDDEAEQFADSVEVIRLPQKKLRSWRSPSLFVPDDYISWVEPAVDAANEVLRRDRFDCIFATVPPYSNAMAATICSGMSGVPFVPDFRDPWSRIDHGWVIKSPRMHAATVALEKRVLRASSRVTMCVRSRRVNDFFAPLPEETRERVVSVPNGFDADDFANWDAMRTERPSKFVVSYIGSIYDEATLRALMEPLDAWRRNHPGEFENVTFEYAGTSSKMFDRFNIRPDWLRDRGFLSHPRAIELKARSAVQMFCLPASMSAQVLSGKIFEMTRAGIPIVAIVRPDSDVVDHINETGTGVAVEFGKPEQTIDALRRFYAKWRDGQEIIRPDWNTIEQYSRERLARKLEQVIIDASLRRPPNPQSRQTARGRARVHAQHAAL
ncbi:MAG: hypothetical protein ACO1Q7_02965 [Gemmatimonas sp.]